MNKIVITGPECSGKTSLARALAHTCPGVFVPEFARSYVSLLAGEYQRSDLVTIAQGQAALEDAAMGLGRYPVICDTGFLVLRIWSMSKYGAVDEILERMFVDRSCDLYVLCAPDPVWRQDGVRENPTDRWSLFYLYHKLLLDSSAAYLVVRGSLRQRLRTVIDRVK